MRGRVVGPASIRPLRPETERAKRNSHGTGSPVTAPRYKSDHTNLSPRSLSPHILRIYHGPSHCRRWRSRRSLCCAHTPRARRKCAPPRQAAVSLYFEFHRSSSSQVIWYRFMGGNSTKATSGINGAGTQTQQELGIPDSAKTFFEDTKRSVSIVCFSDLVCGV